MFIFEVGSTTLFALGIKAKQDAWIVILLALVIGVGFVWVYTELYNAFPNKNYAEMIITILGNKLGIILVLLYVLDCLWHAARNAREFGELILMNALPETPLWVIIFIFILVSLYALFEGMEVLARASEVVMPILFLFIVSLYILVSISGIVDFSKLQPILGSGFKPILKTMPSVVMFPYGEIFVFLMYWKYANEKSTVRPAAMEALILSGIMLCLTSIMNISVLGVKYASIANVPLLETIRLINIGTVISNLDAIGIVIMFFGGFFKMTIYLNAVVQILTTVFKIKNNKLTLILFSIFLMWFSIVFEPSYAYHRWMYPFDANYFALIYSNVFPLLLLMIYWLKKKRTEF
jgi:spore germination protein KB